MMNAKLHAALVILAWAGGVASARAATPISQAIARVRARVQPQITVSEPVVVTIDLPNGLVCSTIPGKVQFTVRTNTREVELQVACTDLCWAGDPTSEYKIPLADPGPEITCEHGSSLPAWLPVSPTDALPAGWTGRVSRIGVLTAPAGQVFNQDVAVEVSWQATDPTLPKGEYQGIVRLIGLVQP